ncbi:hypothetical protein [Oceanobacillus sojae]|uniref:hypothetical protein n=1 Tax=Oceanobacillus sojae TaxID=582851 RepID=UPI00098861FB|nr:hypothetical protein [Oceanobacillus sojae]MCT1901518.1 hypothetical protein [Oceanobacillus sojae]
MNMSMKDWTISLLFTSVLTAIIANFFQNDISIMESIPGVLILSSIAFIGIFIAKIVPLKVPAVVYVALTGLLLASPISPISDPIIYYTSLISFTAPLTVVGTLAGIGLDFKAFMSQSWKMIIIAVFVFTGTFLLQAVFAQVFLTVTNAF